MKNKVLKLTLPDVSKVRSEVEESNSEEEEESASKWNEKVL